jgi:hypothetical protein
MGSPLAFGIDSSSDIDLEPAANGRKKYDSREAAKECSATAAGKPRVPKEVRESSREASTECSPRRKPWVL